MDIYFENQQKAIEELNRKLDSVLEMLTNQNQQNEEEYVQANYLDRKAGGCRATNLKRRKELTSAGLLNPVKMPNGRMMYRKSEMDRLITNGFRA